MMSRFQVAVYFASFGLSLSTVAMTFLTTSHCPSGVPLNAGAVIDIADLKEFIDPAEYSCLNISTRNLAT